VKYGVWTSVLAFFLTLAGWAQVSTPARRSPAVDTQIVFVGLHHPVSTANSEAQRQFDLGLGLIYALDFSGAAKSFQRAATLDPNLAMAYWGISYAAGSDYYYHTAGSPAREQAAGEALQNALALSERATPAERAYITALSKRYCNCPNPNRKQQAIEFKDAMAELSRSHPDDLDAATLYAQSIMNLSPGWLWNVDGTPWQGTPEVLSILESVLKRNPRHIGAAHYYIHAVEGSPHPERALAYAKELPSLAPSIGHIVHMPAHIFIRTGDYALAEDACIKAENVDNRSMEESARPEMFTVLSFLHDLYFLAAAASMDGHYRIARDAADKLANEIRPHLEDMPELQAFVPVQMAVLARFHQWSAILQIPEPDAHFKVSSAFWHFTRGTAFAATRKLNDAEREQQVVGTMAEATPPEEILAMTPNHARDVLEIAFHVLSAKLAAARHENSEAISHLREAVAIQDQLHYSEPPSWFYPVRESLGAMLTRDGQTREAEQVFREDLRRNPRNPRSLYGLLQTLGSIGDPKEEKLLQDQLSMAWKGDRQQLNLRDF